MKLLRDFTRSHLSFQEIQLHNFFQHDHLLLGPCDPRQHHSNYLVTLPTQAKYCVTCYPLPNICTAKFMEHSSLPRPNPPPHLHTL